MLLVVIVELFVRVLNVPLVARSVLIVPYVALSVLVVRVEFTVRSLEMVMVLISA